MKPFLYGTMIGVVLLLIGLISNDWSIVTKLFGYLGFGSVGLAAIFSGALISGDRIRANNATESKEDNLKRNRWANHLFLFGLPNILIMIALYFLMN